MKNIWRNLQSPAYQLVLQTAKKNWWLIVINLVTNVFSAILEGSTLGVVYLAIAYLTETSDASAEHSGILATLNKVLPLPAEQMFLVLIGGAVCLQVCLSLSKYVNRVSAAYLSAKAQPRVTGQVFEQLMAFSYGCVSRYKVGDLVLYANDAALAVDRQITEVNNIIVGLSFALVYLVVIVQLSPMLALAAGVLTIFVAFLQYKLIPRLRRVVHRVTTAQVESAKFITESIQALRLLHTFGTQERAVTEAEQRLGAFQAQLERRALLFYIPEPILDMVPILALGILAVSAVTLQGEQTNVLPLLLTFMVALQRLSIRLKATASTITRFVDNSARMLRLEMILEPSDKRFEQSGVEPFPGLERDIEFQGVSLSYGNDDRWALKELTFTIPRHQVTALVGESGAGKSSVIDLLVGLYQPTAGQILVNHRNLAGYRLSDWRRDIGVVSQDTYIFNDSVLANLRYGDPEASWDEVIAATEAAQAHGFISGLPNGYETVVGERGYVLSGGQRQRLALARALIKQPEILILDEATSALDSESERLIQGALDRLQKDRTVIVVAHRLSTIVQADQILVLDQGELMEQGTHASLLAQDGRYSHYWQLQSHKVSA